LNLDRCASAVRPPTIGAIRTIATDDFGATIIETKLTVVAVHLRPGAVVGERRLWGVDTATLAREKLNRGRLLLSTAQRLSTHAAPTRRPVVVSANWPLLTAPLVVVPPSRGGRIRAVRGWGHGFSLPPIQNSAMTSTALHSSGAALGSAAPGDARAGAVSFEAETIEQLPVRRGHPRAALGLRVAAAADVVGVGQLLGVHAVGALHEGCAPFISRCASSTDQNRS
jgi:hypothetical protein